MKRLFALLLIPLLLLQETAAYGALSGISFAPRSEGRTEPLSISVPESLGKIEKIHQAPQNSSGFIFQISTAHANAEAARKIEKIIQHLKTQYGANVILAEGGSGALHPEFLKWTDDSKTNSAVLELLTDQAHLTGPDLALTKPDTKGIGIEDPVLYRTAYQLLKAVYLGQQETDAASLKAKLELDRKASRVFSKSLMKVFSFWENFQINDASLTAVLANLQKESAEILKLNFHDAMTQFEWPQLVRFRFLTETQKRLQPETLEKEIPLLKAWAKKNGIPLQTSLLEILEDKTIRTGEISPESPRKTVEDFISSAAAASFSFKEYPQILNVLMLRVLESELDAKPLMKETDTLFEQLFAHLASTEEEKELLNDYREWNLLKKLGRLELTPEEWQEIKTRENLPSETLKKAARFYDLMAVREKQFYSQVETVSLSRKKPLILVTGGYHTAGMEKLFEAGNLSYASIRPVLNEMPDTKIYQAMMLGRAHMEKALLTETASAQQLQTWDTAGEVRAVTEALHQFKKTADVRFPYFRDRRNFTAANTPQVRAESRKKAVEEPAHPKSEFEILLETMLKPENAGDPEAVWRERILRFSKFMTAASDREPGQEPTELEKRARQKAAQIMNPKLTSGITVDGLYRTVLLRPEQMLPSQPKGFERLLLDVSYLNLLLKAVREDEEHPAAEHPDEKEIFRLRFRGQALEYENRFYDAHTGLTVPPPSGETAALAAPFDPAIFFFYAQAGLESEENAFWIAQKIIDTSNPVQKVTLQAGKWLVLEFTEPVLFPSGEKSRWVRFVPLQKNFPPKTLKKSMTRDSFLEEFTVHESSVLETYAFDELTPVAERPGKLIALAKLMMGGKVLTEGSYTISSANSKEKHASALGRSEDETQALLTYWSRLFPFMQERYKKFIPHVSAVDETAVTETWERFETGSEFWASHQTAIDPFSSDGFIRISLPGETSFFKHLKKEEGLVPLVLMLASPARVSPAHLKAYLAALQASVETAFQNHLEKILNKAAGEWTDAFDSRIFELQFLLYWAKAAGLMTALKLTNAQFLQHLLDLQGHEKTAVPPLTASRETFWNGVTLRGHETAAAVREDLLAGEQARLEREIREKTQGAFDAIPVLTLEHPENALASFKSVMTENLQPARIELERQSASLHQFYERLLAAREAYEANPETGIQQAEQLYAEWDTLTTQGLNLENAKDNLRKLRIAWLRQAGRTQEAETLEISFLVEDDPSMAVPVNPTAVTPSVPAAAPAAEAAAASVDESRAAEAEEAPISDRAEIENAEMAILEMMEENYDFEDQKSILRALGPMREAPMIAQTIHQHFTTVYLLPFEKLGKAFIWDMQSSTLYLSQALIEQLAEIGFNPFLEFLRDPYSHHESFSAWTLAHVNPAGETDYKVHKIVSMPVPQIGSGDDSQSTESAAGETPAAETNASTADSPSPTNSASGAAAAASKAPTVSKTRVSSAPSKASSGPAPKTGKSSAPASTANTSSPAKPGLKSADEKQAGLGGDYTQHLRRFRMDLNREFQIAKAPEGSIFLPNFISVASADNPAYDEKDDDADPGDAFLNYVVYDATDSRASGFGRLATPVGDSYSIFPIIPDPSTIPNEEIQQKRRYQAQYTPGELEDALSVPNFAALKEAVSGLKVLSPTVESLQKALQTSLAILNHKNQWGNNPRVRLETFRRESSQPELWDKAAEEIRRVTGKQLDLLLEMQQTARKLMMDPHLNHEQYLQVISTFQNLSEGSLILEALVDSYQHPPVMDDPESPLYHEKAAEFLMHIAKLAFYVDSWPMRTWIPGDLLQTIFYDEQSAFLLDFIESHHLTQSLETLKDGDDIPVDTVAPLAAIAELVMALHQERVVTDLMFKKAKPAVTARPDALQPWHLGLLMINSNGEAGQWIHGGGAQVGGATFGQRTDPTRAAQWFQPEKHKALMSVYPSVTGGLHSAQAQMFYHLLNTLQYMLPAQAEIWLGTYTEKGVFQAWRPRAIAHKEKVKQFQALQEERNRYVQLEIVANQLITPSPQDFDAQRKVASMMTPKGQRGQDTAQSLLTKAHWAATLQFWNIMAGGLHTIYGSEITKKILPKLQEIYGNRVDQLQKLAQSGSKVNTLIIGKSNLVLDMMLTAGELLFKETFDFNAAFEPVEINGLTAAPVETKKPDVPSAPGPAPAPDTTKPLTAMSLQTLHKALAETAKHFQAKTLSPNTLAYGDNDFIGVDISDAPSGPWIQFAPLKQSSDKLVLMPLIPDPQRLPKLKGARRYRASSSYTKAQERYKTVNPPAQRLLAVMQENKGNVDLNRMDALRRAMRNMTNAALEAVNFKNALGLDAEARLKAKKEAFHNDEVFDAVAAQIEQSEAQVSHADFIFQQTIYDLQKAIQEGTFSEETLSAASELFASITFLPPFFRENFEEFKNSLREHHRLGDLNTDMVETHFFDIATYKSDMIENLVSTAASRELLYDIYYDVLRGYFKKVFLKISELLDEIEHETDGAVLGEKLKKIITAVSKEMINYQKKEDEAALSEYMAETAEIVSDQFVYGKEALSPGGLLMLGPHQRFIPGAGSLQWHKNFSSQNTHRILEQFYEPGDQPVLLQMSMTGTPTPGQLQDFMNVRRYEKSIPGNNTEIQLGTLQPDGSVRIFKPRFPDGPLPVITGEAQAKLAALAETADALHFKLYNDLWNLPKRRTLSGAEESPLDLSIRTLSQFLNGQLPSTLRAALTPLAGKDMAGVIVAEAQKRMRAEFKRYEELRQHTAAEFAKVKDRGAANAMKKEQDEAAIYVSDHFGNFLYRVFMIALEVQSREFLQAYFTEIEIPGITEGAVKAEVEREEAERSARKKKERIGKIPAQVVSNKLQHYDRVVPTPEEAQAAVEVWDSGLAEDAPRNFPKFRDYWNPKQAALKSFIEQAEAALVSGNFSAFENIPATILAFFTQSGNRTQILVWGSSYLRKQIEIEISQISQIHDLQAFEERKQKLAAYVNSIEEMFRTANHQELFSTLQPLQERIEQMQPAEAPAAETHVPASSEIQETSASLGPAEFHREQASAEEVPSTGTTATEQTLSEASLAVPLGLSEIASSLPEISHLHRTEPEVRHTAPAPVPAFEAPSVSTETPAVNTPAAPAAEPETMRSLDADAFFKQIKINRQSVIDGKMIPNTASVSFTRRDGDAWIFGLDSPQNGGALFEMNLPMDSPAAIHHFFPSPVRKKQYTARFSQAVMDRARNLGQEHAELNEAWSGMAEKISTEAPDVAEYVLQKMIPAAFRLLNQQGDVETQFHQAVEASGSREEAEKILHFIQQTRTTQKEINEEVRKIKIEAQRDIGEAVIDGKTTEIISYDRAVSLLTRAADLFRQKFPWATNDPEMVLKTIRVYSEQGVPLIPFVTLLESLAYSAGRILNFPMPANLAPEAVQNLYYPALAEALRRELIETQAHKPAPGTEYEESGILWVFSTLEIIKRIKEWDGALMFRRLIQENMGFNLEDAPASETPFWALGLLTMNPDGTPQQYIPSGGENSFVEMAVHFPASPLLHQISAENKPSAAVMLYPVLNQSPELNTGYPNAVQLLNFTEDIPRFRALSANDTFFWIGTLDAKRKLRIFKPRQSLTGDTALTVLLEKKIELLDLVKNSFLTAPDFSEVRGNKLTGTTTAQARSQKEFDWYEHRRLTFVKRVDEMLKKLFPDTPEEAVHILKEWQTQYQPLIDPLSKKAPLSTTLMNFRKLLFPLQAMILERFTALNYPFEERFEEVIVPGFTDRDFSAETVRRLNEATAAEIKKLADKVILQKKLSDEEGQALTKFALETWDFGNKPAYAKLLQAWIDYKKEQEAEKARQSEGFIQMQRWSKALENAGEPSDEAYRTLEDSRQAMETVRDLDLKHRLHEAQIRYVKRALSHETAQVHQLTAEILERSLAEGAASESMPAAVSKGFKKARIAAQNFSLSESQEKAGQAERDLTAARKIAEIAEKIKSLRHRYETSPSEITPEDLRSVLAEVSPLDMLSNDYLAQKTRFLKMREHLVLSHLNYLEAEFNTHAEDWFSGNGENDEIEAHQASVQAFLTVVQEFTSLAARAADLKSSYAFMLHWREIRTAMLANSQEESNPTAADVRLIGQALGEQDAFLAGHPGLPWEFQYRATRTQLSQALTAQAAAELSATSDDVLTFVSAADYLDWLYLADETLRFFGSDTALAAAIGQITDLRTRNLSKRIPLGKGTRVEFQHGGATKVALTVIEVDETHKQIRMTVQTEKSMLPLNPADIAARMAQRGNSWADTLGGLITEQRGETKPLEIIFPYENSGESLFFAADFINAMIGAIPRTAQSQPDASLATEELQRKAGLQLTLEKAAHEPTGLLSLKVKTAAGWQVQWTEIPALKEKRMRAMIKRDREIQEQTKAVLAEQARVKATKDSKIEQIHAHLAPQFESLRIQKLHLEELTSRNLHAEDFGENIADVYALMNQLLTGFNSATAQTYEETQAYWRDKDEFEQLFIDPFEISYRELNAGLIQLLTRWLAWELDIRAEEIQVSNEKLAAVLADDTDTEASITSLENFIQEGNRAYEAYRIQAYGTYERYPHLWESQDAFSEAWVAQDWDDISRADELNAQASRRVAAYRTAQQRHEETMAIESGMAPILRSLEDAEDLLNEAAEDFQLTPKAIENAKTLYEDVKARYARLQEFVTEAFQNSSVWEDPAEFETLFIHPHEEFLQKFRRHLSAFAVAMEEALISMLGDYTGLDDGEFIKVLTADTKVLKPLTAEDFEGLRPQELQAMLTTMDSVLGIIEPDFPDDVSFFRERLQKPIAQSMQGYFQGNIKLTPTQTLQIKHRVTGQTYTVKFKETSTHGPLFEIEFPTAQIPFLGRDTLHKLRNRSLTFEIVMRDEKTNMEELASQQTAVRNFRLGFVKSGGLDQIYAMLAFYPLAGFDQTAEVIRRKTNQLRGRKNDGLVHDFYEEAPFLLRSVKADESSATIRLQSQAMSDYEFTLTDEKKMVPPAMRPKLIPLEETRVAVITSTEAPELNRQIEDAFHIAGIREINFDLGKSVKRPANIFVNVILKNHTERGMKFSDKLKTERPALRVFEWRVEDQELVEVMSPADEEQGLPRQEDKVKGPITPAIVAEFAALKSVTEFQNRREPLSEEGRRLVRLPDPPEKLRTSPQRRIQWEERMKKLLDQTLVRVTRERSLEKQAVENQELVFQNTRADRARQSSTQAFRVEGEGQIQFDGKSRKSYIAVKADPAKLSAKAFRTEPTPAVLSLDQVESLLGRDMSPEAVEAVQTLMSKNGYSFDAAVEHVLKTTFSLTAENYRELQSVGLDDAQIEETQHAIRNTDLTYDLILERLRQSEPLEDILAEGHSIVVYSVETAPSKLRMFQAGQWVRLQFEDLPEEIFRVRVAKVEGLEVKLEMPFPFTKNYLPSASRAVIMDDSEPFRSFYTETINGRKALVFEGLSQSGISDFRLGDDDRIKFYLDDHEEPFYAAVLEVTEGRLITTVPRELDFSQMRFVKHGRIKKDFNETIYRVQLDAINKILAGPVEDTAAYVAIGAAAEEDPHSRPHVSWALLSNAKIRNDAGQLEMLAQSLNGRALEIGLGPFGTGKSTTLAEINLQNQLWNPDGGFSAQIVTAQTHAAVDRILLLLKKAGIEVLRVGSDIEKIHPDLQENWIYKDRDTDPMWKKRVIEKIRKGKAVIGGTIIGLANDHFLKELITAGSQQEKLEISSGYIDEASVASVGEMLTILSMIHGRAMMIGDVFQLGVPTLDDELKQSLKTPDQPQKSKPQAPEENSAPPVPSILFDDSMIDAQETSLFETLFHSGLFPITMLRDVYRTTPIMVELANPIYGGKLRAVRQVPAEVDKASLVVIDTSIFGQRLVKDGTSAYNDDEAQVALWVFKKLASELGLSMQQMGVITPYAAQLRRVKKGIMDQIADEYEDFEVRKALFRNSSRLIGTVYPFQGNERPLILNLTTRQDPIEKDRRGQMTAPTGYVGRNMLNVMHTRAQELHIELINFETFRNARDPQIREDAERLFQLARSKGTLLVPDPDTHTVEGLDQVIGVMKKWIFSPAAGHPREEALLKPRNEARTLPDNASVVIPSDFGTEVSISEAAALAKESGFSFAPWVTALILGGLMDPQWGMEMQKPFSQFLQRAARQFLLGSVSRQESDAVRDVLTNMQADGSLIRPSVKQQSAQTPVLLQVMMNTMSQSDQDTLRARLGNLPSGSQVIAYSDTLQPGLMDLGKMIPSGVGYSRQSYTGKLAYSKILQDRRKILAKQEQLAGHEIFMFSSAESLSRSSEEELKQLGFVIQLRPEELSKEARGLQPFLVSAVTGEAIDLAKLTPQVREALLASGYFKLSAGSYSVDYGLMTEMRRQTLLARAA